MSGTQTSGTSCAEMCNFGTHAASILLSDMRNNSWVRATMSAAQTLVCGQVYLAHSCIFSPATRSPLSPVLWSFDKKKGPLLRLPITKAIYVSAYIHYKSSVKCLTRAGCLLLSDYYGKICACHLSWFCSRVSPQAFGELNPVLSWCGFQAESSSGIQLLVACASAGFELQLLLFLFRLEQGDKHSDGPVFSPPLGMDFVQTSSFFSSTLPKLLSRHLV